EVRDQGGERLIEGRHEAGLVGLEGLAVRVPAAERNGGVTDAGFDEAAGGGGPPAARRRAVGFARRGLLQIQFEGLLRLVRTKDFEGLAMERVEPVHEIRVLVHGLEAVVELLEQRVALLEFVEGELAVEADAADAERRAAALAVAPAAA